VLIDAVTSGDRNVINREVKKILRYKNVTLEVLRMRSFKNKSDTSNSTGNWNHLKTTQTIPAQYTGRTLHHELKKTAILGTAHILREVLM
jgi:hypothetical protein